MSAHLRSNLLLIVLTLGICAVFYPLVLWGVGQAVFPDKAAGSLITRDGQLTTKESDAVGSRLIGQPFSGAGYYKPRPSNAGSGYNAATSSGSNWGASNVKLRDRATRILGTVGRYKTTAKPVGPDIEKWFAEKTTPSPTIKSGETDLVTVWARTYPTLASVWVTADPVNSEYVKNWSSHEKLSAQWRADNKPATEVQPKPEELAVYFFASFATVHPGKWPVAKEQTVAGKPIRDAEGKPVKAIELVTADDDLRATFFAMWFADTKPDLERVPSDMVLSSGSGLDPHITLRNAQYQTPGIVAERAQTYREASKSTASPERIEMEMKKLIDQLIERHRFTPMWGLVGGDPLVPVVELNLALDRALTEFKVP